MAGDETPFFPAPPTHVEAPQTTPGSHIDRYVVVETVGEGGMGTVLRAYDPRLRREVAIKRIRPDVLGAGTEARLEREAQAMARLTHPNVVSVYDVHAGGHGVFITMEFVPGRTMSRWWDDDDPSMELRLEGLRQAGEGLRAAHQAGLVHRDFKPNNVLVVPGENTLVAKVTDFGLARSFDDPPRRPTAAEDPAAPIESTELEPLTQAGVLLGTPGFMAPEQYDGEPADHRSDQYAFCVTAWQALTGKRPDQDPDHAKVDAMPRHIRAALERGLSAKPSHRFAGMDQLLEALHGQGRPWRRWVFVGGAAAALTGVWASTAVAERRARSRCATEAQAVDDVWNATRREALEAGLRSEAGVMSDAVTARVVSEFDDYAQRWTTHREEVCVATTVEETLEPRLGRDTRTCLDARLRHLDAMIDVLSDGGTETLRRAVSAATKLPALDACRDPAWLHRQPRPPVDPAAAEQWEAISDKLRRAEALTIVARYDTALELSQAAIETAREVGSRDALARALVVHGGLLSKTGDYARSETELEEAYLELTRLGNDTDAAQAAISLLYVVGYLQSRHTEGQLWRDLAEVALDRADALRTKQAARWLDNSAALENSRSDFEAARELAFRAVQLRREIGKPDDPDLIMALMNLAAAEFELANYDVALPLHEEVLALRREAFGQTHPDIAFSLHHIGTVKAALGEDDEAERLYREAIDMRVKTLGPSHFRVAETVNNLAVLYAARGQYDQAKVEYARAAGILETALGADHPAITQVQINTGAVEREQGQLSMARATIEAALEKRLSVLGKKDRTYAEGAHELALVLDALEQPDAARAQHADAIAVYAATLGEEHPEYAMALMGQAEHLAKTGELDQGRAVAQRAIRILEASVGGDHDDTVDARKRWAAMQPPPP